MPITEPKKSAAVASVASGFALFPSSSCPHSSAFGISRSHGRQCYVEEKLERVECKLDLKDSLFRPFVNYGPEMCADSVCLSRSQRAHVKIEQIFGRLMMQKFCASPLRPSVACDVELSVI